MRHAAVVTRYETGKVYDRQQLHAAAAAQALPPGNANAGIVQVGGELCIFWNPFRRFYANRWLDEPREFIYSGEGSLGPMETTSGNRHLLAAEDSDRPVTLFYKMQRRGSDWQCLGRFRVVEHAPGVSVDKEGKPRADVRFRLVAATDSSAVLPLPAVTPAASPELPDEDALWDAVARRVGKSGGKRRRGASGSKDKRQSDPLKTMYVLRRAIDFGGLCESCLQAPGWLDDDGKPHFQAHHVVADVDLVDWIGAVCGTCHDRLHHGVDRAPRADALRTVVKERQVQLGRPTYELSALPKAAGA